MNKVKVATTQLSMLLRRMTSIVKKLGLNEDEKDKVRNNISDIDDKYVDIMGY